MRSDYNSRNLAGLGTSSAEEYTTPIAAAAMFIPGVGPFISAGLAIVGKLLDGLFGWGGPPIQSFYMPLIQARLSLANANRAMGKPDDFVLPSGWETDPYTIVLYIVNEYMHVVNVPDISASTTLADLVKADGSTGGIWTHVHANIRSDMVHVGTTIKNELTQLQTEALNSQNFATAPPPGYAAPMTAPLDQGPPLQDPSGNAINIDPNSLPITPPVPNGQAPAVAPMSPVLIAGGIGLVLLVLFAAKGN